MPKPEIVSCPECGSEMLSDQKKCPNCMILDIKKDQTRRKALKAAGKDYTDESTKKWANAISMVIGIAFVYWLFGGDDTDSYSPPARPSISGEQMDAWAYIQLAVEARLKNPNSASFPSGGHRAVKDLGGRRYSVVSYVEAKNSFGATVRTPFSVTIRRVAGGWQVEALQLQQ